MPTRADPKVRPHPLWYDRIMLKVPQRPRRRRQLDWLRLAVTPNRRGEEMGIHVGVESGPPYNRDLRDLVKRGLLKMSREAVRQYGTYAGVARHSVLRITEAGRTVLARRDASHRR